MIGIHQTQLSPLGLETAITNTQISGYFAAMNAIVIIRNVSEDQKSPYAYIRVSRDDSGQMKKVIEILVRLKLQIFTN